jgi:hypothetical protein
MEMDDTRQKCSNKKEGNNRNAPRTYEVVWAVGIIIHRRWEWSAWGHMIERTKLGTQSALVSQPVNHCAT